MSKIKSIFKYYGVAVVVFALLFATICVVFYTSDCYRELEEKNEFLMVELADRKKNESNALIELNRISGLLAEEEAKNATLYSDYENATKELQIALEMVADLTRENEYYSEISEYVFNGDWCYDYTEEDVKLLAGVMFGEEEGNTLNSGYAGSVPLNRIMDSRFPNNLHDVIYEIVVTDDAVYEQYAPRTKKIAECVIAGKPIPSDLADVEYIPEWYYDLARILLKYGSILPPDVVYQAHYPQGKGVFWEWKGEYFCYG